jgi:hypothetical protein
VDDTMSPVSQEEDDDDDDLHDRPDDKVSQQRETSQHRETSVKSSTTTSANKNVNAVGEMAMDMESLNRCDDDDRDAELFIPTRLPAFSTIIGNVAEPDVIPTTTTRFINHHFGRRAYGQNITPEKCRDIHMTIVD